MALIKKKQLSEKNEKIVKIIAYILVAVVASNIAVDVPGVIQGKIISGMGWGKAIIIFSLSFMVTDIIKSVIASLIAIAVEKPLAIIRRKSN